MAGPRLGGRNNSKRNTEAAKRRCAVARATTPTESKIITQAMTEAEEGREILVKLAAGEPIDAMAKRLGVRRDHLIARVTSCEMLAPHVHRQLTEGIRTFLANLVIDDVLHFRPTARAGQEVDIEERKLAAANYRDAKDSTIKLFNLHKEASEAGARGVQQPHTPEEFAEHLKRNPEARAMLDEIHALVNTK